MSIISYLTSSTHRLQVRTQKRLEDHSRPSNNFFVLTGLSAAIAACGLILDNTSIVIGAMVVAPLTTPMFDLALSLIIFRMRRVLLSLSAVALGMLLAIATGGVVGFVIALLDGRAPSINPEIASRLEPSFLFFLVALLSGAAGAYAYSRPKVPESITGIAISVAVIPPLAVTGLGIVMQSRDVALQSFFLYLLNMIGIIFGSVVMFIIVGMNGNGKVKS